jgi:hypothetical protein
MKLTGLTRKQYEQTLKLTDVQKRWLENYLEAKRDFESERLYQTTRRVMRVNGVWKQIYL